MATVTGSRSMKPIRPFRIHVSGSSWMKHYLALQKSSPKTKVVELKCFAGLDREALSNASGISMATSIGTGSMPRLGSTEDGACFDRFGQRTMKVDHKVLESFW